ncbi:SH3 domain-containing protein 19 isoform X3 [Tachysurus fulvidraco]|uniref:SH3 domain-containing protein 19 isoform X3 n=1 Tax=Tachysurus fulvidraco TaxID=1234273 RepID=UPI001FF06DA1|nr:SH3 domain-containing protein 19 isoform X3 [Tachysurus fulvidraco]
MAEARVEDEEETFRETREAGGTRRNARAPTAASDRADRNKPEQRQSSTQGALSSIRAVIKRTSTRTAAPTDQTRERRRPEITILAAEPLASNSWFPGTSGAFPMAPPPVQPSWTSSVTVELPPPSYAQVIREKSREQNTHASSVSSSASASSPSSSLSSSSSSSAPRHTATISTQTDPEASEPQSCTKPSSPAKPPSHRRPPPPSYTPAHTPAHTPPQISSGAVSSVSVSKSSPSLPHQSSEGELLPLRPPPIKLSKPAGSSVNPAKNNQHSGSRGAKRGPPLPPRPVPGHPLYRHYTSKSPQGTNKVNPPSSEPGESHLQKEKLLVVLDDAATNQQPTETPGFPGSVKGKHQDSSLEEPVEEQTEEQQPETNTSVRYRAHFAFNGEDGELTFRDGDVITLIAYVNEEWGRGSLNGRTGIFPLNFVQLVQENPEKKPTAESHAPVVRVLEGQTGRALYDFTPESEDELCLKVGDVVSSLEEVDDEWFVGELAGRRGIIPKNYIQLL